MQGVTYMKKYNRALSILLSVLMLVSVIPAMQLSVSANEITDLASPAETVKYEKVSVSRDVSGELDAIDLLRVYLKSDKNYEIKLESDFDYILPDTLTSGDNVFLVKGNKILDLNGHQFTISNFTDKEKQYLFYVGEKGDFTVNDSSGNDKGTILFKGDLNSKASQFFRNAFLISSGAKMTFNGGTVDGHSKKVWVTADACYGWKQTLLTTFTVDEGGTLVVNGGNLQARSATYYYIAQCPMFIVKDEGACNVTINGGNFVAKGGADIFTSPFGDSVFRSLRKDKSVFSINGGVFKVDTYDAQVAFETNGSHEISTKDCRKGAIGISYKDFKGKSNFLSLKVNKTYLSFTDADIGSAADKSLAYSKNLIVSYSDNIKNEITCQLSYPAQVFSPKPGTIYGESSGTTSVTQGNSLIFSYNPLFVFNGFATEEEGTAALGLTEKYRIIVRKRNALDAEEINSNHICIMFDEPGYWDVTLCGMLCDVKGNVIKENRYFYSIQVNPKYSISFTSDNKIIDKYEVLAGTYVTVPTIKKDGATLLGWCFRSSLDKVDLKPGDKYPVIEDTCLFAVWGTDVKVTLDGDGGLVSPSVFKVPFGGTYGKLPSASKAGYTFTGWYNEAGEKITEYTPVTTTDYHTLTARYSLNLIEVTLDAGEGATITNNTLGVHYGEKYKGLDTVEVTKPGYRFEGWYYGNTKVTADSNIIVPKDHTLKARYVKTATITFDSDGGNQNFDSVTVDVGSKCEAFMQAPSKSGYMFSGWKSGSTYYTPDTVITGDVTVKATWASRVTVTFNANGGTCSTTNATIAWGAKLSNLPIPTRSGYSFAGWYTAADGGDRRTIDYTYSASTTLYAHWSSNTVTFYFYADNTYSNLLGTVEVEAKGSAKVPALGDISSKLTNIPGYNTEYWYSLDGSTEKRMDTSLYKDGTRFYAKYIPKSINIKFDANGGVIYNPTATGYMTKSVKYNAAFDVSISNIENLGYRLVGWFTDPEFGTQINTGDINTFTEDTTLYAHWTPGVYSLCLWENYENATNSYIDVIQNSPVGELYTPVRTGYTFNGWFTDPVAGTKVTSATTFDYTAFRDGESRFSGLYAHWTQTEYKITLKAENGTMTASKDKAYYGEDIIVTVTPDEGCAFDGFSSSAADVYPVVTTEGYVFTMPAKDITITAKIHKHSYDAGTVVTPATATEAGLIRYACTVEGCTAEKYSVIDPLGVEEPVLPPDETETDPPVEFIPGDVDGDGDVDVADARYTLRAAIRLTDTGLDFSNPDNREFKAADCVADGIIKVDDARRILRAAIKLEAL